MPYHYGFLSFSNISPSHWHTILFSFARIRNECLYKFDGQWAGFHSVKDHYSMAWLNNKFPYFIELPWARNKRFSFMFLFMFYWMYKTMCGKETHTHTHTCTYTRTPTNRMSAVDIRIIVIINKRSTIVHAFESDRTTVIHCRQFTSTSFLTKLVRLLNVWKLLCFTCSWGEKIKPVQIIICKSDCAIGLKSYLYFESVTKCVFHLQTKSKTILFIEFHVATAL